MAGKPRAECKIVSGETWSRARHDYLSGMTAPAVAARHGVGVGGLRGRIQREGWTKVAQAAANAPQPPSPEGASDAPLGPEAIRKGACSARGAPSPSGRPASAPKTAARDGAHAERMGWADWLYDADGQITPGPEEDG